MGDVADNFLTLLQAAAVLGLSKSRVEQYIRDGRLAVADTVGGVRLLDRAAVAALKDVPKRPRGRPKVKADPPAKKPRGKGPK